MKGKHAMRTRYGSLAIYLAATAALAASPAAARDYWNGSGFSLDHNFHSPYDNMFGRRDNGRYFTAPGYPAPGDVNITDGNGNVTHRSPQYQDATPTERNKAIRDERTCAPVVLYTDEGRVVQPALGCRR
jgi:hypothetical protein